MANPYNMSDVFLSYSRKDSEFVHKLLSSLTEQGKEIWADFEDIPKAADWQLIWHDPSYVCELSCFERRIYLDNTIDCSVLPDQPSATAEPTAAF